MLTNAQMKEGRFAKWAKARKQERLIKSHLAKGHTVQITTYLKATRYTAKHADMFVAKKDGLYVRSGKNLVFVGWADIRVFG